MGFVSGGVGPFLASCRLLLRRLLSPRAPALTAATLERGARSGNSSAATVHCTRAATAALPPPPGNWGAAARGRFPPTTGRLQPSTCALHPSTSASLHPCILASFNPWRHVSGFWHHTATWSPIPFSPCSPATFHPLNQRIPQSPANPHTLQPLYPPPPRTSDTADNPKLPASNWQLGT